MIFTATQMNVIYDFIIVFLYEFKFIIFISACHFVPFHHNDEDNDDDDDEDDGDDDGDEEEIEELQIPDEQQFVPEELCPFKDDPYPSLEKKKEILEFFRSPNRRKFKKAKTLEQIRHKYALISDLRILYRWEKQLANGNMIYIYSIIFIYFSSLTFFYI